MSAMYRTKEDILALGSMDPELQELLKTTQQPTIDFSDPARVLHGIRAYMAARDREIPSDPNVVQSEIKFQTRDGLELRMLVFKPAQEPAGPSPLLVIYHGGGGAIGSPENNISYCRSVVKSIGAICVSPEYRLGPEHPWPTGPYDAWDALKWISANAERQFGASLSAGFVVGGVSNGANLASLVAHMARDENLSPTITGLFLSAGAYATAEIIPEKYKERYLSRAQDSCLDSPVLNRPMKTLFTNSLGADLASPMYSTLIWPTGHRGIPPTYLQVCGMDISRDDSLILEEVIREESGVKTKMDVYPGMPHIFWTAFSQHSLSKKWEADTVKGFAWLFGKQWS